MGKVNLTPYIKSPSITSVLSAHDNWLNQSVTTTSDVLFKSIHSTGSVVIDGDFTVLGANNISESTVVKYKSHILIVNDGEMGSGVHLNEAGIEVDRGMLENVRIVFREADRTFRVGKLSSAQAIATREDVPLDGGLMVWNATSKKMLSMTEYPSDLRLTSLATSSGIGTGAFIVDGDSSFASNVRVGGRVYISGSSLSNDVPSLYTTSSNDLRIESPAGIAFTAESISIPTVKPLWFGDAVALYAETIGGVKDFFISTNETGRVRIPSVQDAITRTTASVVLNGGISVGRTFLLGGEDIDYAIWATESNVLQIQTRNPRTTPAYPTILSVTSNTLAPNTELRLHGPSVNGHLSLKFKDTRFLIQPSSDTDLELSSSNGNSKVVLSSDGTTTLSGPLSLPPTFPFADDHATSKLYTDTCNRAIASKPPVRMATTSAGFLAGYVVGATVDGVVLQLGDRILVKDAIDRTTNGIWVVGAGLPIRPVDFKQGYEASGCVIFVAEGDVNTSTGWICTCSAQNDTVGTDALTFSRFTGLGAVSTGTGLVISADNMDANVDGVSIELSPGGLRLSSIGVSTGLVGGSGTALSVNHLLPHVVEVGTLTGDSQWNGRTVQTGYGGTGRTSFNTGALVHANQTNSTGALADDVRLKWDASAGILNVDGDVVASGVLTGGLNVVTSDVVLSDKVNCSASTYKAQLLQNGSHRTFTITLEIVPTVSHSRTSLQVTLPTKITDVVNRMEVFCIATGICELDVSAGLDGIVSIENITAFALVGTKRIYLGFTCNEADKVHQLNFYVIYSR